MIKLLQILITSVQSLSLHIINKGEFLCFQILEAASAKLSNCSVYPYTNTNPDALLNTLFNHHTQFSIS
ncbi:MAG: hypothetical protein ACTS73_03350 [Arsenophonus sp. NEOnobi-MAG3]